MEDEGIELTGRLLAMAVGISKGHTVRTIAETMGVKYETARSYRKRLGERLGLSNKVAIAAWVNDNVVTSDSEGCDAPD